MIGFVSIDNRPEFFIDLLNSTFLNETFMYNVTNTTANSFDAKEDKRDTIEFVLMSIVTVFLGLLILITIIGKRRSENIVWRDVKNLLILLLRRCFFRKCFCHYCGVDRKTFAEFWKLSGCFSSCRWSFGGMFR